MVEKAGEYRAVCAPSGKEALVYLASEPFAAVLTDLQMPDINGLELVEIVRQRHPLVPVILMTAVGSEEIAIEALRAGAASYVPKRNLPRDLADTLESVIGASRDDRRKQQLHDCVTEAATVYQLENDAALVPPLVAHLQQELSRFHLCNENQRIRLGVALEESLLNGIYHGNLELSSELRQDGRDAYERLAQERRQLPPFQKRRLFVSTQFSRGEAVFTVRDEGPGFDVASLPDPTDPANLERTSGRGMLLIRTFMDDVCHNARGNEITLIKRRN